MSFQRHDLLAGGDVPDSDRFVAARGEQCSPVRCEGEVNDAAVVTVQDSEDRTTLDVTDRDILISSCFRESISLWRESHEDSLNLAGTANDADA